MTSDPVVVIPLERIESSLAEVAGPWAERVRVEALSAGVYALGVGEVDRQRPHHEDEIYVVIRGRAVFEAAGERQPVEPGAVLYVGRDVEHRFVDITEALLVAVVFAPPEGSGRR